MKAHHRRTTTTLVLLGLCIQVNAQSPYRPFPEGDAGWVEGHGWLAPNGSCSDFQYDDCERSVYFGADTVIDGTVYHTLLTHGLCHWQLIMPYQPSPPWCQNWAGTYPEPRSVFAFLRQDTAERRVYVFDTYLGTEALLYDFSIGLGPYPLTYNNPYPDALSVVALDSMELNDGWHRTWVLGWGVGGNMDSAFCTVIEGVGSTFGVLAGLAPPFENSEALYCQQVSGNTVFPLGDEGCDLNVGSGAIATPRPHFMLAYPNPTKGPVTITGELPFDATYVVMDPFGRMVGRGRLVEHYIDLSGSAPAPYLIRIQDGNGRSLSTLRVLKVD